MMSFKLNHEIEAEKKHLVFHKIHFTMKKHVKFGQAIYVCGDIPELGCWLPQKAFRLKWNQDDVWNGSVLLSNKIPIRCQYKYMISDWSGNKSEPRAWEVGLHNRQLELDLNKTLSFCGTSAFIADDRWNMDRISLNITTPKSKMQRQEKYYVTGQINELGNWKEKKLMKRIIRNNISFQHKKENIYENILEDKQIAIFTYSFYIFRARQTFSYSYIKKGDIFQAERAPRRVLKLNNQFQMIPNRINIFHPRAQIFVLDQCRISQINYSQVTKNIFVGSYIKSRTDLMTLKQLKIDSILSIQSQKDFKKNGLSPHYLKLLCEQAGIKYRRYSIEDMSKEDFIMKAEGAVKAMHELLSYGGNIYVHCSAGIYRSPQIIALYLAINSHLSIEQAVHLVKFKHPYAKPNVQIINSAFSFVKLKRYLKKISI